MCKNVRLPATAAAQHGTPKQDISSALSDENVDGAGAHLAVCVIIARLPAIELRTTT